ncbi:MAG TPA: molybdenum ABC transporter ATP-binding protein [Methylibium sp.]|nr:molybdenum ABC transporter ATP-binding protein [Methylibium sp.]
MSLAIDVRVVRGAATVQGRLEVPPRGITALIGRSGAGKSTLLQAACGLLRPAAGRIALDGVPLFDADAGIDLPPQARRLGVVFQDGRLFPHRSVRGNLLYGAKRAPPGANDGPGFDEVVTLLGLAPLLARRPFQLSGGERQRVALGRALLARPRALLMDEPLASLDPPRRHELLGYLAGLPARLNLPILYVTHQMDEVMRLADRVVLMADGAVAASGGALELLSDLTLGPLVGRFEAGGVLAGVVAEQLEAWQLSVVAVAGQHVTVPRIAAPVGSAVRLRIRARDVALQREVLASSASNQLAGTVLRVLEREPPYAAVELGLTPAAAPGERLWALVTQRSVQSLAITPGQPMVASFKAVAVEGRAAAVHAEAAPT